GVEHRLQRVVLRLRLVRTGPWQQPARLRELGLPGDIEAHDVDRVVVRRQAAHQLQSLAVRRGGELLVGDRVLAVALLVAGSDRLVGRARGVRIDVVVERDRTGPTAAGTARSQSGRGEGGAGENRHTVPDTVGPSPHLASNAEFRLEWLPDR